MRMSQQVERGAEALQGPMKVGNDEYQPLAAGQSHRRKLQAPSAVHRGASIGLCRAELLQALERETSDPSSDARRHEKLRAFARIERQHSKGISRPKRTQPERLQEVIHRLPLRSGPEAHRCGDVDDRVDGHAGALPIHAHEPFIAHRSQTRPQVEPARIGPVVQARVRDEDMPGSDGQPEMRAGAVTPNPHR